MGDLTPKRLGLGDEIKPYVYETYQPFYMPLTLLAFLYSTTPLHHQIPPHQPPCPFPYPHLLTDLSSPSPTNTPRGSARDCQSLCTLPAPGQPLLGHSDTSRVMNPISRRWAHRGTEGEASVPNPPHPLLLTGGKALNSAPGVEEGNQAQ